jgi:hypothetical protein
VRADVQSRVRVGVQRRAGCLVVWLAGVWANQSCGHLVSGIGGWAWRRQSAGCGCDGKFGRRKPAVRTTGLIVLAAIRQELFQPRFRAGTISLLTAGRGYLDAAMLRSANQASRTRPPGRYGCLPGRVPVGFWLRSVTGCRVGGRSVVPDALLLFVEPLWSALDEHERSPRAWLVCARWHM